MPCNTGSHKKGERCTTPEARPPPAIIGSPLCTWPSERLSLLHFTAITTCARLHVHETAATPNVHKYNECKHHMPTQQLHQQRSPSVRTGACSELMYRLLQHNHSGSLARVKSFPTTHVHAYTSDIPAGYGPATAALLSGPRGKAWLQQHQQQPECWPLGTVAYWPGQSLRGRPMSFQFKLLIQGRHKHTQQRCGSPAGSCQGIGVQVAQHAFRQHKCAQLLPAHAAATPATHSMPNADSVGHTHACKVQWGLKYTSYCMAHAHTSHMLQQRPRPAAAFWDWKSPPDRTGCEAHTHCRIGTPGHHISRSSGRTSNSCSLTHMQTHGDEDTRKRTHLCDVPNTHASIQGSTCMRKP